MTRKNIILLLVIGLSLAASIGVARDLPKLVISEKIIDLGQVPQGAVKDVVFTLKNEGAAPLLIAAARPTCGCTVADFDKEIAPGESGEVRAKLDTSDFRGPISKSILVACNDPATPTVALAIRADVRPFIAVYPRPLVRFNTLEKQAAVQKITVAGTERSKDFKLTGAKAELPFLDVSYRKIEDRKLLVAEAGEPQYEVSIELKKDAPPGPVNTSVSLSTNRKEEPEIKVQVIGVVRAMVRVSPPQLEFGAVELSLAPTRNLVMVNNVPDHQIAVTKVSVDDPSFEVKTTTVEEGKRYTIAVSVKKDAEAGVKNAVVTIYTDDPDVGELKVPVRAALR